MSDLNTLTIAEARDALRKGDTTSVELTEACLTEIDGAAGNNTLVVNDNSTEDRIAYQTLLGDVESEHRVSLSARVKVLSPKSSSRSSPLASSMDRVFGAEKPNPRRMSCT